MSWKNKFKTPKIFKRKANKELDSMNPEKDPMNNNLDSEQDKIDTQTSEGSPPDPHHIHQSENPIDQQTSEDKSQPIISEDEVVPEKEIDDTSESRTDDPSPEEEKKVKGNEDTPPEEQKTEKKEDPQSESDTNTDQNKQSISDEEEKSKESEKGISDDPEITDENSIDIPDEVTEPEEVIPPEEPEDEFIGEDEIIQLKILKEKNINENQAEVEQANTINEKFQQVKQITGNLEKGAIDIFIEKFEKMLNKKIEPLDEGLSIDLKEKLESREKSLNLCLKMLTRLNRYLQQFQNTYQKMEQSPPVASYQWVEDENIKELKKNDFTDYIKQIKKAIETVRNNNYHLLREKNEITMGLKNNFLNFFKDQFFPVIDGLDSGQKFYKENYENWIETYQDNQILIKQRFEIYDSLIDLSNKFLKAFYIFQIEINEKQI